MSTKTKRRTWRFISPLLITLLLVSPLVSSAETAGNFSVTNNGNTLIPASTTNHLVMQFDLPSPANDPFALDGGVFAVAAGDALSAFSANNYYSDEDHSNDNGNYSGAEVIVESADTWITAAEIITPGTADLKANWNVGQSVQFGDEDHDDAADYDGNNTDVLIVNSADNNIAAAEIIHAGLADLQNFPAAYFYLETDADSTYDHGEDIVKLTHDGATASADGDLIGLFAANDYYSDANSDGSYTDGELIVSSADANLDSGDTITTAGAVWMSNFGATVTYDTTVGGKPYCIFNDLDSNNTVSNNDVLIFDCGLALGDGHVMSCPGDAGCGDALANMTADHHFYDDNTNATYDATELIWFDADSNGDLDAGEIWQGFSTAALTSLSGSLVHFYNDGAAGNGVYDDGEDIFTIYFAGAANNVAAGDTLRTFDAGERFSDNNNDADFTVTAVLGGVSELIANSADAVLSPGEVVTAGYVDVTPFTVSANYKYSDANNSNTYNNGELIADSADNILDGTEIVLDGNIDLVDFATWLTYHDGSGDGKYTDGEDIIVDNDSTGYYNADQLTSLKIGNPGTCLNTALTSLDIWEDTNGNNTFDIAADTNIVSVGGAPFFGADHLIGAASIYTAASNERTIFVTIDSAAVDGSTVCTVTPIIPNTGGAPYAAQFLSADNGPTDGNVATTDITTIDLVSPTPNPANITTTITENAGSALVVNPTDIVNVVWDSSAYGDVASVSADFADFGGGVVAMRDDGAGCDTVAADHIWCAAYTVLAGTIDDTDNDVTITLATDLAGNVAANVTDDIQFSVDNQAPVVTAGNISVLGATGTAGAFKRGDNPVPTWNNSAAGDNNSDIVSVTIDGSAFRAVDNAMSALDNGTFCDPIAADGIWCSNFTGLLDGQDDINNNVSLTVVDDAGNVTVTAGTNNYVIDTLLPSFLAINTVQALKQDGAAPTLSTQLWYYYTGQNLRLQVNHFPEGDGNDLTAVKACLRSMNEDVPAQLCSTADFTNPANYQSLGLTAPGSNSWTLNYALAGLPGGWPTQVDGYQVNVELTDDAGNVWSSANAAEFLIAVFNVIPQNIVPSLNNATTTDWSTITDFTNVPAGTIVFNAQNLGVDIARMTFNAPMDLTDQATVTGLQALAANTTTTDSILRLDSSALAAFDIATQLMIKPTAGVQPSFVVKDDAGVVLGSIPSTAGPLDSYNFAAHGTASNFVWAAGPDTLTFDVTGFSSYEADTVPPTATIVPATGSTGVAVNSAITVTFSEAMNTGSFTYTLTPNPGGLAVAWSGGNTVATISHTAFANNTTYAFNITGGDDLSGNAIAPTASSFTTIAASGGGSGLGGGGGGGGGGSASFGAPACSGEECNGTATPSSEESTDQTDGEDDTAGDDDDTTDEFEDTIGHWAATYIQMARTQGYIDGYADNTFKPDQQINRAEAAKLIALWMMQDLAECTTSAFSDVDCSEWFAKYVMYLKLMQVIEGYADGTFRPGSGITRAEALKMMLFAKGITVTDVDGITNIFSDIDETDWYYSVVLKAYSLGIISGYPDGTFGPNMPITRAEFTKIFVNTLLSA